MKMYFRYDLNKEFFLRYKRCGQEKKKKKKYKKKTLKHTLKRLTYICNISIINLFNKNKLEVYCVKL